MTRPLVLVADSRILYSLDLYIESHIHPSLQVSYRSKVKDVERFITSGEGAMNFNLKDQFGKHSSPVIQLLLKYSNSLEQEPSVIIDKINKRNEMDEVLTRKLIPRTQSRMYIEKAMCEVRENLFLQKNNCSDTSILAQIERNILTLRLAQSHPTEVVFHKALRKFYLVIHTHHEELPNGYSSIFELSPFSLDSAWETEYGVIIPLPEGMFELTIFDKLDSMLYTESKIQVACNLNSSIIKHINPLRFYNNWLLQCRYQCTNNSSLFYECLSKNLIRRETLLDYIKNSLIKVE